MFKLVCGAGNEDCESVKRLVYIYAKAGCRFFDLSARKEILESAKDALKLAKVDDAMLCVSIGIKGDPHITKAKINESKCIKCGNCFRNCPNDAIYSSIIIDEKKCIGCGNCIKKCPTDAISMFDKDVNVKEILPYMVKNGVEVLELHIMGHDKKDLAAKWNIINECRPKFASICIDRENFGNKEALSRIKEMIAYREPYTTIIQADGIPMSGADDTFKTTLQAVAMAEIIQNTNLPVHIMISGGTNSKTKELAELCGIKYWGIAIGSWARKIVKQEITTNNFWQNETLQNIAIQKASDLITTAS
ncbi:4Fe-4S dicluster domain-containing protein [bacterium]|nr:4Fe-4S dicluster domain-containing protein [bacterium]